MALLKFDEYLNGKEIPLPISPAPFKVPKEHLINDKYMQGISVDNKSVYVFSGGPSISGKNYLSRQAFTGELMEMIDVNEIPEIKRLRADLLKSGDTKFEAEGIDFYKKQSILQLTVGKPVKEFLIFSRFMYWKKKRSVFRISRLKVNAAEMQGFIGMANVEVFGPVLNTI